MGKEKESIWRSSLKIVCKPLSGSSFSSIDLLLFLFSYLHKHPLGRLDLCAGQQIMKWFKSVFMYYRKIWRAEKRWKRKCESFSREWKVLRSKPAFLNRQFHNSLSSTKHSPLHSPSFELALEQINQRAINFTF